MGTSGSASYSWIGTSSGVRGLNLNYTVTQHECAAELYIDRGKDGEAENKAIFDQLRWISAGVRRRLLRLTSCSSIIKLLQRRTAVLTRMRLA